MSDAEIALLACSIGLTALILFVASLMALMKCAEDADDQEMRGENDQWDKLKTK